MPVVPVYDNLQTGIRPAAANVSGPAPGAIAADQMQGAARAVNDAAGQMGKILLDAQEQANQVRVNDAMNQAIGARLKWTHDKEAGFTVLQGRAALDRPDGKSLDFEYEEKLSADLGGIAGSLGNDAQKRAFQMQAGQLVTQFRGQVQAHMATESKQFALSTQAGTVKVAQDQAGLEPFNPDIRTQSANAIKAAVAEAGRIQGLAPVDVLARTVEALSPMHGTVLTAMIQQRRLDDAKAYLADSRAELTPTDRAKFEGALQIGQQREKVQAWGDSVMGKSLSQADALAATREKFAGVDRDEAVKEIEQRYQEREIARTRDAKATGNAAWSAVMETGRIPAPMLADLRTKAPEEERQIRDWLDAKWRRAKADAEGKATTDMDVYYGLRRMAMDDPAAFGQIDLRKSQPYLKDGDLKHLIEIQGGISRNDAKAMESQRMLKSTLSAVRADVLAAGIDLTPKEGTPQAKQTAIFMGTLTQALDAATASKGSPLTAEEGKRIGLSMVREGVEQGSGIFGVFQTTKRGFEIATDPALAGKTFVTPFDKIPLAARDALRSEMTGEGPRGGLTNAQRAKIERAYQRGLEAGRFR